MLCHDLAETQAQVVLLLHCAVARRIRISTHHQPGRQMPEGDVGVVMVLVVVVVAHTEDRLV